MQVLLVTNMHQHVWPTVTFDVIVSQSAEMMDMYHHALIGWRYFFNTVALFYFDLFVFNHHC